MHAETRGISFTIFVGGLFAETQFHEYVKPHSTLEEIKKVTTIYKCLLSQVQSAVLTVCTYINGLLHSALSVQARRGFQVWITKRV
jgi:hypothetical protein